MEKFFVSCQPGMEKILENEITQVWNQLIQLDGSNNKSGVPRFEVLEGGVELATDLILGLQLNFFLKTASRILLRLDSFKCRDLPKLYQRLTKFNWLGLFWPGAEISLEISASKSRLNNEKRIQTTALEAIDKATQSNVKFCNSVSGSTESKFAIYIRAHEDEFTVSVDTSGEHLHKRSWATKKGIAPMRETLASALLYWLIRDSSLYSLSQVQLIDPMCGSGTLLTEAVSLFYPNFTREYAFKSLKICPKILLSEKWIWNYRGLPDYSLFAKYWGLDKDLKVLKAAQDNFESIEKVLNLSVSGKVEFKLDDLFQSALMTNKNANQTIKNWVVCNPPYGERLSQSKGEDQRYYFEKWFNQIVKKYAPERIAVIYPTLQLEALHKIANLNGFKIGICEEVRNGGIKTQFVLFDNLRENRKVI